MKNILDRVLNPSKPDFKNITPVELDAIAEEVTVNYVNKWVRLRVTTAKVAGIDLGTDPVYVSVIKYITDLCSTYNFTRLWSTADVGTAIWSPLMANHDLWNFVTRGYSEFSAKVFVHTTMAENISRGALINHIADGITGFNNKPATDANLELVPAELRAVLPRYDELSKLMEYNPWLLFIYYLSRVDLYSVIFEQGESNE